jgi:branched-subunit amino acid transport protein AzlD
MSKGNVLVVSRTAWSEAPRLRHQLSRLLRDIGYEIYYVQLIFGSKSCTECSEEGINVYTVYERLHHQLKPFAVLQNFDSTHICKTLKKVLPVNDFRFIVNFNYDNDYTFSLFPGIPAITVINDDFYVMAKPWMRPQVLKNLAKTVSRSRMNLSVSYSLDRQLSQFSSFTELFLPWSDINYKKPASDLKRDVVLYYGFVSRLDMKLVGDLCNSGIKLRFVGPVQGNGLDIKEKYGTLPNVEFLNETKLTDLDVSDVCCSIALYDCRLKSIQAITASNRMFQLLAIGIPLIYPNLPNLILAPDQVIRRCISTSDFLNAISYFKVNFDSVQPMIERFLIDHTKDKRKHFIERIIESFDEVKS